MSKVKKFYEHMFGFSTFSAAFPQRKRVKVGGIINQSAAAVADGPALTRRVELS